MSMSNLTTAAQRMTEAADAYHGKIAAINVAVQNALAAVPSMARYIIVNQANGDDTNNGTDAAPLKTMQKAFDRTPRGGLCFIVVDGDYHFSQTEYPYGHMVTIKGRNQPKLTFDWQLNDSGEVTRLASLSSRFGSNFHINSVDIEFPPDPLQPFSSDYTSGLIGDLAWEGFATVSAKFFGVNFYNAPAATKCSIFGQFRGHVSAYFSNCVFPANWEGRIRENVGGAGTDPNDYVRTISTNLSWL